MWWKIHFELIQILIKWLLQHFAHGMTAVLSNSIISNDCDDSHHLINNDCDIEIHPLLSVFVKTRASLSIYKS